MVEESKNNRNVVSDSEQIPVVWRYELLKYLRSKRLYASIAIVAVVMTLLYLLPLLLGDSYDDVSPEDFATLFLNFATWLVIICATFFGADAIVGEFQNRTGYLVFPNPMKRSTLFVGKFCASLTAGMIVMTLFYVILAVLSLVTVGGLDDDFLLSFAYATEYLVAAMAVAYLVSSLLKGTTGATVLTFFLFIMILPIVDSVSMFAGVKIEGSLTFSANALIYVLMDPYPQDVVQDMGPISFHAYYPDPGLAHIVMLAYAVIALALGLIIFKRRQLAG